MSRNPFTRSGALRLNHPLFRGRAKELARLEQACLSDLDFFPLVCGGRQNGKTTVLLRLEDQLKARRDEGIRVCRVDFQGLPRASSPEAYRHLARTVARVLPQAPQPPDAPDAPALGDFLEDALAGDNVLRLVLLLSGSRAGRTLNELAQEFGVGRRTIERMIAAIREVCGDLEQVPSDEAQKRWRLPPSPLAVPSSTSSRTTSLRSPMRRPSRRCAPARRPRPARR